MTTQMTKSEKSNQTDTATAAETAVAEARAALENVQAAVPQLATASRAFVHDSLRAIDRSSDQQISSGVTLSLGLAIGLLLGGAPRILTAIALIPVAALGLALLDRRAPAAA